MRVPEKNCFSGIRSKCEARSHPLQSTEIDTIAIRPPNLKNLGPPEVCWRSLEEIRVCPFMVLMVNE